MSGSSEYQRLRHEAAQVSERIVYLKDYIRQLEAAGDHSEDLRVARDELKAEMQRSNLLFRKLITATSTAA